MVVHLSAEAFDIFGGCPLDFKKKQVDWDKGPVSCDHNVEGLHEFLVGMLAVYVARESHSYYV